MKIVIPMAGMGTRMRPHTLITPKPLLKIAGKALVERIVSDLKKFTGEKIEEVHYVIGNFGSNVEKKLIDISKKIGAKGFIHYQKEALGTAHAVYCAQSALEDEVIIAFADTMFVGSMNINTSDKAIIWTLPVKNPENYGVVLTDKDDYITDFAEKPKKYVSDKAIIGIYYFKKAEILKKKIEDLIEQNKSVKGEFQLTDALQAMKNEGIRIKCKVIEKWLDCGNKSEFLKSTESVLTREKFVSKAEEEGSRIIKPVYIGSNVEIESSVIGPFVCIEDNSVIKNSNLERSIIGMNTVVDSSMIKNSLVGNFSKINKASGILNIGDYCEYEGI